MTTAVVGAGPVGLVCALSLAERGEQVLLVDPDPGPSPDGTWRRHGVMQFNHPHFFRHLVRGVLEEHVPQMWQAVVAAGCVVNQPPEGAPSSATTVAARRATFEAALRTAAQHPNLRVVPATADEVVVAHDRVTGLVVDGTICAVDRVVLATGRASILGDDLRPAGEGGPCGQSYVSRMYRARPGVEPLTSWVPLGAMYDGYLAIAFPQDAGTLSALVVRRSTDKAWSPLLQTSCFDTAVAAIPNLAPWTDPDRFEPITDVMRGGTLTNTYRGQGTPPAGVFFVGDAVCTTNPSAGRGVSLGLLQAGALLSLLTEHADPKDASQAFDTWCLAHVKPWYDDHVAIDAHVVRTYDGEELDVEGPLTSDVLCAAADEDPSLLGMVGLYQGMVALPSSLQPVEDRVRRLLRQGWRPTVSEGPTRDELLDLMSGASV